MNQKYCYPRGILRVVTTLSLRVLMAMHELTATERQEADRRAGCAVNFACPHVREALQTRIASRGDPSWSVEILPDGRGSVLVCLACRGISGKQLLTACPQHKKPMMFPTQLELAGGTVIEPLYYCPVEGCPWRYSETLGYKKATEF